MVTLLSMLWLLWKVRSWMQVKHLTLTLTAHLYQQIGLKDLMGLRLVLESRSIRYFFWLFSLLRLQWLVTYLTLVRQWTSCYCLWCMPTTASSTSGTSLQWAWITGLISLSQIGLSLPDLVCALLSSYGAKYVFHLLTTVSKCSCVKGTFCFPGSSAVKAVLQLYAWVLDFLLRTSCFSTSGLIYIFLVVKESSPNLHGHAHLW